jgi:hypothetical protein
MGIPMRPGNVHCKEGDAFEEVIGSIYLPDSEPTPNVDSVLSIICPKTPLSPSTTNEKQKSRLNMETAFNLKTV